MRLVTLSVLSLVGLAACSVAPTYLPDGGRARVNCTSSPKTVAVKVTRFNLPSDGVLLTATNVGDGRHDTSTTDANGVGLVSDILGPGQVRVTGALNDLTTTTGDLFFTCGECDCTVTPSSLNLTLQ